MLRGPIVHCLTANCQRHRHVAAPPSAKVKFSGLPATEARAAVMFEEPRKVELKDGAFEDWFGPNEVHVYRVRRKS